MLGLLDLPDPFPGLSPPPNFKFLARAQKGSGNETRHGLYGPRSIWCALDGPPDYLGPPDYTVLGLFGPH